MKLTAKQLKRLAKEARKLAMECLTNGPRLRNDWCGCAVGLSLNRAGLWSRANRSRASCDLARHLESEFSANPYEMPENGILSDATRQRLYHSNRTAVVFPLLAWADELEAASAEKEPHDHEAKRG